MKPMYSSPIVVRRRFIEPNNFGSGIDGCQWLLVTSDVLGTSIVDHEGGTVNECSECCIQMRLAERNEQLEGLIVKLFDCVVEGVAAREETLY